MELLICAADDCTETFAFDPLNPGKKYHSEQCAARMRMRRYRKRKHLGGNGGGGRQRRLFPKPLLAKAKPPKLVPVAEPTLFETDMLASLGGAAEYHGGDETSPRPIRTGIMLSRRKRSRGVLPGADHAA